MRFLVAVIALLAAVVPQAASSNTDAESTALRGNSHRELRPQHPCTILEVDTDYDENSAEFLIMQDQAEYQCALHPSDQVAAGRKFVDIQGIDTSQLINITSGETTMEVEGAIIENGAYTVPAGAKIHFGMTETRRRLANKSHGTKKILVVRAITDGGNTISQRDDIVDAVFGTFGNPINMRSQYLGCSQNKLDMAPYEGTTEKGYTVTNGIIEVTVGQDFRGQTRYDAVEGLHQAAEQVVGDLEDQFDHVIFCLPPGTQGNWVAYAYVNTYIAAFNDQWCEKLSTLVHEVGHNLNLAHSGTATGPYNDKHCIMGFSYNQFNGPLMCFNPAKSWQLGWYDDQSIEWNPNDGTFLGTLVGTSDYGEYYEDYVVVKLKDSWSKNIFIGYNRATGFNRETKMSANMVTIVQAGDGYSQSTYLDGISMGGKTIIPSFGTDAMDLTIEFLSYGSTADEAVIAISYGDCVYPICCEGGMCAVTSSSITEALLPTPSPIPSPTSAPIPAPTSVPTPSPNQYRGTGTPVVLFNQDFSTNLNGFSTLGEKISRRWKDAMMVAQFVLKDTNKPPRLEMEIDVQGMTIISTFFWFKAENLDDDQAIVIRYSLDGKQTWEKARVMKFGSGREFQLDQWYRMTDAFFTIPQGTQSIHLQVFGRTGTNDETKDSSILLDDASSQSEFFIGKFFVQGDSNP